MKLTHLSLFSGIGGIDLAAEWAGFQTVCFCEKDKYCQQVLRKHWPDVPIISDIKDVNIDTIADICYNRSMGGSPCDYVVNAKKNPHCQVKHGQGTCVESAIQNINLIGEIETETDGDNILTSGKNKKEMKLSNITERNVSVVGKQPQNSLPSTTKIIMEQAKENDSIKLKCGKLPLKEDCPMITKSSATTVTTQKKSMGYVPTKEIEDVKDVTKEKIATYTNCCRSVHEQPEIKSAERGYDALSNPGTDSPATREDEKIMGDSDPRLSIKPKRKIQTGRDSLNCNGESGIDLISGGFPCQPHSVAGKRKGSSDSRNLWPEFRRVIGEVKPRWVLAENVPGLFSSDDGRFFGGILSDLAALGYVCGWCTYGAVDVGALHRRDRVFILAHAKQLRLAGESTNGAGGNGRELPCLEAESCGTKGQAQDCTLAHAAECIGLSGSTQPNQWDSEGCCQDVADTKCQGQADNQGGRTHEIMDWSAMLDGSYRESRGYDYWGTEPNMGRVANGIPHRVDRLKGLGNAVVPQQIYPILKAIADTERGK